MRLSDYLAAAGNAETKEEPSRNNRTAIKQGPGSSSRILTIPLSFSAGTKAPTQVEDDDFMLSTRFLELHPVTSPPTNQKKVCIEWTIMKTLNPSPNDSLLENFYCWAGSAVGFWTQVYLLPRLPGYKENFFSNQHFSLEYWFLSGKQSNLSSLTKWLIWPWKLKGAVITIMVFLIYFKHVYAKFNYRHSQVIPDVFCRESL